VPRNKIVYISVNKTELSKKGVIMHNKEKEDRHGMIIGGIIVLGIGVLFLLSNLDIIPDIGKMWPIILVVVGFALLIGAVIKREPKKPEKNSESQ
jgi:uncharacterized membrane protein HdeD (DUF308 family)